MSLSPENKALLEQLYDFGPPLPAQFVFSRESLDELMNAVRAQPHPDVARLVEALKRIAEMNPRETIPELRPAWRRALGIARAAIAPFSSTEEKG
jgi:hypothetical protein